LSLAPYGPAAATRANLPRIGHATLWPVCTGAHLRARTLIVLTSGAKVLIVTVSHTN